MIAKVATAASVFDATLLARAAREALVKLDPRRLVRNPVIFVTEVVSAVVTVLAVRDAVVGADALFTILIALWLWFTVLFATFAEAVAEGRGKAQAEALRRLRAEVTAKRLADPGDRMRVARVGAGELRVDDSSGNNLRKVDYDPAPFFGATFTARF